MTTNHLLLRLFTLANKIAEDEIVSGYAGIAEVRGSASWSFVEHLTELPERGRAQLLRALVKRRFAMEGLRLPETDLSESEQLEVQYWLKHSNSMHGTRQVPFFAMSTREEEFESNKAQLLLARRAEMRLAVRRQLNSCALPIQILSDKSNELRWCTVLPNQYRVSGWVDMAKPGEQAASFVAVFHANAEQPGHIPTSFLGILGIGETSWRFLHHDQENLFSASTIRFFCGVCEAVAH